MYKTESMYLLKINILNELHVLGVNAQYLQAAGWIRNTDIHFTVKAAEST